MCLQNITLDKIKTSYHLIMIQFLSKSRLNNKKYCLRIQDIWGTNKLKQGNDKHNIFKFICEEEYMMREKAKENL